jgi:SMI1-KNR4 cell-wall
MVHRPIQRILPDLDLDGFWDDDEYALREYVAAPPSDALIASVEAELEYRLPGSYVALMRVHNGGVPHNTCCLAPNRTTWATDHVAVHGIMGIGREKPCSLAGDCGSRFWIDEWGYPDLGVYFADCPSAGHDMIAFDYRDCGRHGEPRVVHIDQENDYRITVLAPDSRASSRLCGPETPTASRTEHPPGPGVRCGWSPTGQPGLGPISPGWRGVVLGVYAGGHHHPGSRSSAPPPRRRDRPEQRRQPFDAWMAADETEHAARVMTSRWRVRPVRRPGHARTVRRRPGPWPRAPFAPGVGSCRCSEPVAGMGPRRRAIALR